MSRPSFSFTPLDDQFTLKLSCKYTFRLIKRARVLTNTLSSRESICFELNEFPRLIGLQVTSFLPNNAYFRKYFRKDYLNEYISVSSKNDRFGHIFRSVLELELINRSSKYNDVRKRDPFSVLHNNIGSSWPKVSHKRPLLKIISIV